MNESRRVIKIVDQQIGDLSARAQCASGAQQSAGWAIHSISINICPLRVQCPIGMQEPRMMMGKAKSAAVGALAQKRRHFTLGSLTVANRPSKFGKVSQGLSISGPFLNQMIWMLKHTIDKNVLTGQLFFVTNANQMIKYGLNDTIRIKSYPRGDCERPCFDQLNEHILERLLFC